MKKFLGLLIVVIGVFCYSFTAHVEIDDVVGALKSGNAAQLSKFFDNRVDITLPDKADNYSRSQAEMIMRDFFTSNTVRNFSLRYKSDNADNNYCVGTLLTNSGNYRTTLVMKQKGNKQFVQDLTLQKVQ